MNQLIPLNAKLLDAIWADDFAGYDPFDLLNSRLLKATPFYRSEWVRLGLLQLGKRSPINLRPLLMVPKKRNPKGVGLFISGLLQDYQRTGEARYLNKAIELADWLLSQRSDMQAWGHSCWGYHFDWQARAFYVPAGKPNIITTCYVARALYELGQLSGKQIFVDVALDAAYFISTRLYTKDGERDFYAYIPGERAFVHNASLWGAAWCGFAGKQLGDAALVEQARRVAHQSVREQSENGSWVYGARHHHQFIDGFHTGYNLEALCLLRDALGSDEFDECIERGYHYYLENFFTEKNAAKYYNTSLYPIDMHSFAQAVFTLLKVGGRAIDQARCEELVGQAIELLYIPSKGRFIYQRSRWFSNRVNYTRWTQAWAYYSLSFYNRYLAELDHAQN